jgi:hypothetical protein
LTHLGVIEPFVLKTLMACKSRFIKFLIIRDYGQLFVGWYVQDIEKSKQFYQQIDFQLTHSEPDFVVRGWEESSNLFLEQIEEQPIPPFDCCGQYMNGWAWKSSAAPSPIGIIVCVTSLCAPQTASVYVLPPGRI